jgi:hypothetical protein
VAEGADQLLLIRFLGMTLKIGSALRAYCQAAGLFPTFRAKMGQSHCTLRCEKLLSWLRERFPDFQNTGRPKAAEELWQNGLRSTFFDDLFSRPLGLDPQPRSLPEFRAEK